MKPAGPGAPDFPKKGPPMARSVSLPAVFSERGEGNHGKTNKFGVPGQGKERFFGLLPQCEMVRRQKRFKTVVFVCLLLAVSAVLLGCSRRSKEVTRTSDRISSSRSAQQETIQTPSPEGTQPVQPEQQESAAEESPVVSEREDPLLYSGPDNARYIPQSPEWTTLRFEWVCQDNYHSTWMEIPVDKQMYAHYRNLSRYYGAENFERYVNEACNQELIRQIVSSIRDLAEELSYDDGAAARELVKFVQDCITYEYDIDSTGQEEYPRYPIETLYERRGDCEDTSILLAALLKEWGYEVGFLHLPGHLAVAIRATDDYEGGSYYEIDGKRYLFIETTGSDWEIGTIPDTYKTSSAQLYLIP